MKPVPPAPSSDLDRARALSRALTSPSEPRPSPSTPYTRLPTRPDARPDERERPEPRPWPPLETGARWPRAIAWAREGTGARAALAIQPSGLLVAAEQIDDEAASRVGGHVAQAVDRLAALGTVRSLDVRLAGESALVVAVGEGDEAVLLVLLGPTRSADAEAIAAALARAGT